MLERRFWSNFALVFLGLVICLSIWQITLDPGETITVPPQFGTVPVYTHNTMNSSYTYPMESLPTSDYTSLIDLTDFKFNFLNVVCDSSCTLLILVHTAPKNVEKRNTIRKTWGQVRKNLRIAFMLGLAEDVLVQKQLEKENEVYHDFVQGNFLDSYRNLTYKHVMAFKYAIYHCPQAKYILKTDDDIFVNIPAVMDFLNLELSPYGAKNLLLCRPLTNLKVKRTFRSKWRVSFKEYPEKYYPPYCPGWALLYSSDVVFTLYQDAQRSKYFWIDDVLITGILAKKNSIEHTVVDFLTLSMKNVDEICSNKVTDNGSKLFLYGQPDLTKTKIYMLWNFVNNHTIRS